MYNSYAFSRHLYALYGNQSWPLCGRNKAPGCVWALVLARPGIIAQVCAATNLATNQFSHDFRDICINLHTCNILNKRLWFWFWFYRSYLVLNVSFVGFEWLSKRRKQDNLSYHLITLLCKFQLLFPMNISYVLQWNVDQNSNIIIQENTFDNVVCKKATILSKPHCTSTTVSSKAVLFISLQFCGS